MSNHHGNPTARGSASRASELLAVAAKASEDTPSTLTLQVRLLAARFGVAPALAPIVAEMAFSNGRAAQ